MTASKGYTLPTLDERLEMSQAEGWNPQPGDSITGHLVMVQMIESKWGQHPMLTLDTGDGAINVHAFHQVLHDQLNKLAPSLGTRLTIKYSGERPLRKDPDRKVHLYTAFDADNPPTDEPLPWGQSTGGAEDAPF